MMKLEQILTTLNQPAAAEVLRPHWEESLASLPGIPAYLEPDAVRRHRDWGGLDASAEPVLLETARRVAADPELTALSWHCYRLLFEHLEYRDFGRWPSLEAVLGEQYGAFYLLVALAMVPRVREVHVRLDVPEETTRETCLQLACYALNYANATDGRLGITLRQIYWLRHYVAGRLFRVGRMEYKLEPYSGLVEAYRHRETGQVVALAPDGVQFNDEGYVESADVEDTGHGWTSRLRVDATQVTGTPLSARGMAVRREVCLPLAQWEHVLGKGDITLDMHIPAGGSMTPESCADSLRRGTQFFRRFFPDQPFRAITCNSWIFNNQLETILPDGANLVAFQRELYLYPVRSSGQDGLWFIFLRDDFNPATLPRRTSLQRAIADFLAAGNRWRGGGMFFLTDDLPRYGMQCYRSRDLEGV